MNVVYTGRIFKPINNNMYGIFYNNSISALKTNTKKNVNNKCRYLIRS